jgi:hypothetical protein
MQEFRHELGYFGNIWVRQNVLRKAGDASGAHYHLFDHISLLTSGAVSVELDGYPTKTFTAPTFIAIKKDHKHRLIALTDNVVYYCVFAMRDENGELSDIVAPENAPYFMKEIMVDDYWQRRPLLERLSHEEQPFPSWTFNSNKKIWQAPDPYPNDGYLYDWDEDSNSWIKLMPFENA